MAIITLRLIKGSTLTFTELDNNFSNLNNDKLDAPLNNDSSARVVSAVKPTIFEGNLSVAGQLDVAGIPYLTGSSIVSSASVLTTPGSTVNYSATLRQLLYFTTNTTANFTLNFRGSSTQTLNSVLSIGQSINLTVIIKNGSSAYMPTVHKIDGVTFTPTWLDGIPTAAANSIELYEYKIIKTANATFTTLASKKRYDNTVVPTTTTTAAPTTTTTSGPTTTTTAAPTTTSTTTAAATTSTTTAAPTTTTTTVAATTSTTTAAPTTTSTTTAAPTTTSTTTAAATTSTTTAAPTTTTTTVAATTSTTTAAPTTTSTTTAAPTILAQNRRAWISVGDMQFGERIPVATNFDSAADRSNEIFLYNV